MNGYPQHFYRWFMWIAVLVWITGLLLASSTLEIHFEYTLPWQLNEVLKHHTTTIHAVLAFTLLWLFGAIWTIHVRSGWRKKMNRKSGMLLMLTFVIIIFSGLGIYYLGDERLASFTALSHLSVGCLFPVLLITHIILGRKTSKQRTKHLKFPRVGLDC